MKIKTYQIFNESKTEDYLNSILDKMLNKSGLTKTEKNFLASYEKENEREFYEKFKKYIEKEQYLDNIKTGSYFDMVMFNPKHTAVSTKEIYKIGDDEYEINSTTDGWLSAYVNKDTLIKIMTGEESLYDLDWE